MKQILVVRHVKAHSAVENLGDFVREITDAGTRHARHFARRIAERNLLPQLIISSDAVRAVQTAQVFQTESGYDGEIEANPDLYDATEETWLQLLRGLDNKLDRVMLVGHNPAVEALVHLLTGAHCKMKAGAVAVVDIGADDWRSIADSDGSRLNALIEPADG
ncbi:MAG: hypothetical protein EA384_06040 [Spirochaetaceae bacterium]|nr:MAG: hypothetical protein EA384_06040 [Spirochaetaceae bacterium]